MCVCNTCNPSNCYVLQWRLAEVCQRLEHDLEILGVTAIEDRLQVCFFVYLGIDAQILAQNIALFVCCSSYKKNVHS